MGWIAPIRKVTNVLLGPLDSNDASERRPRISAGAPSPDSPPMTGRKGCSTGYPPLLRRSKVPPRVADGIECQIKAWVEVLLVERGVKAVRRIDCGGDGATRLGGECAHGRRPLTHGGQPQAPNLSVMDLQESLEDNHGNSQQSGNASDCRQAEALEPGRSTRV